MSLCMWKRGHVTLYNGGFKNTVVFCLWILGRHEFSKTILIEDSSHQPLEDTERWLIERGDFTYRRPQVGSLTFPIILGSSDWERPFSDGDPGELLLIRAAKKNLMNQEGSIMWYSSREFRQSPPTYSFKNITVFIDNLHQESSRLGLHHLQMRSWYLSQNLEWLSFQFKREKERDQNFLVTRKTTTTLSVKKKPQGVLQLSFQPTEQKSVLASV